MNTAADKNVRRFILFRVFFNARFYYPVFGVLFLDYGLTLGQHSILNFVWAVAFVALLGTVMGLLNFFLSNYLNAMIDSSERATVLSFRGLAFNMGYGFVSVLFAMLMRHLTADASPETTQQTIFAASLFWLPWYFLLSLLPLAAFARISGCLRSKPASSGKICALDS